jgi:hypothetical protein
MKNSRLLQIKISALYPETMKKILILVSFNLFFISLNAQDIIITKSGDSIKCEITKVTQTDIYFRYLKNGGVEKTFLPIKDIDNYQYFHPGADNKAGGVPPDRTYPHIRFGAGGGYSYRLEKIPQDAGDFKEYLQKLKSGFNIEAEAGYFIKKAYGIGLRYNFFRATNYMDNITFIVSNGHSFDTVVGNMGDNIGIHYIGPVFYYRFFNRNEKIAWLIGISLGYARYVNNGILMSEDVKFSASTAGISAILGADYFILKNMAIGLSLSADIGTLTSITKTYKGTTTTKKLAVQERIDISLINLTAGIRFWK